MQPTEANMAWPAILLDINTAPQEGLHYLSLLAARLVHDRFRRNNLTLSTIDLMRGSRYIVLIRGLQPP